MFADNFMIDIGGTTLKGRRLTIREIRENNAANLSGELDVERAVELIRSHVTLEDGSAFDPYDLTPTQLQELLGELILPKEGRGISDFIGLLS